MPSAELKSATRAPIPPALQELLEREAVLTMSRKRIAEAIATAEKAVPSKSLPRPLLSLFAKKDNLERQKEAADNLAVLRAGLQQIESLSPIVDRCLERSLENFLREHDPEYCNGLAASRFIDDWNRLLAQFESSVSAAMGALQGLLESIKHVPGGLACGKHEDCRKRIDVAVGAARAVQSDITFLNKIADSQRIRAGVDAITLYRQPERNWRGAVHALHFVEGPAAVDSVGLLLEDINDVAEKVREAIRGEVQLAAYAVGYGITSYLQRVWGSLREAAPLRIDPTRLEVMVDETEALITTGRLQVWEPERRETRAATASVPLAAGVSAGAPTPRPPPPAVAAPTATSAPPTTAAPSARAPGSAPPPIRRAQGPDLRLPSRGPRPPLTAVAEPAPNAAPPAAGGAPDSMEELMVERGRLEQILLETRASLTERENFLNESENRLMKASQEQIERQVELEQREEQLRDLEKRLREMQASLGLAPAPVGGGEKPPAERDEFNE